MMTVSKEKYVSVPVWLLSGLSSMIVTIGGILIAWGVVKTKVERAVQDIETLRTEKVNQREFDRLYEEILGIKSLIQNHMENDKK